MTAPLNFYLNRPRTRTTGAAAVVDYAKLREVINEYQPVDPYTQVVAFKGGMDLFRVVCLNAGVVLQRERPDWFPDGIDGFTGLLDAIGLEVREIGNYVIVAPSSVFREFYLKDMRPLINVVHKCWPDWDHQWVAKTEKGPAA